MVPIFDVIPEEDFEKYKSIIQEGIYKDKSLVIAIIDSIFSISSKYESTVKVVKNFVAYIKIDRTNEDYTTSDFIKDFKTFTDEELATELFKNRQRTSTVNGILKASAVKQIVKIFNVNGIETKADLLNHKNIIDIENQVKKVKGQASGITFEYIMMHAGDENRFKPDRHIYTFFEKVMNYGRLGAKDLELVFLHELNNVKQKYPYFTARTFDSLIWEFIKHKYL